MKRITGINLQSGQVTDLYTVPAGKVFVITSLTSSASSSSFDIYVDGENIVSFATNNTISTLGIKGMVIESGETISAGRTSNVGTTSTRTITISGELLDA